GRQQTDSGIAAVTAPRRGTPTQDFRGGAKPIALFSLQKTAGTAKRSESFIRLTFAGKAERGGGRSAGRVRLATIAPGPICSAVQLSGRMAMDARAAAAEPAAAQRREKLGALPEWDLSDLYPGPDSEPLMHDLSALAEGAEAFRGRYEGGLAALSGAELGAAVEAYERLQEKIGRILSYASLVHAGNLSDPEIGRFYQTMQERTNAVSTALLFLTLELNRLDDAELEAKVADPALAHYRPWLRDTRAFRPHQ